MSNTASLRISESQSTAHSVRQFVRQSEIFW